METILAWKPAYLIKAYPELMGIFTRGENHLIAYLHNWTHHLQRKGKESQWVQLTQRQIAEAIDYSLSSVKRFIKQCNEKIVGCIDTRSRQVWLTKNFYYMVTEYRINWDKIMALTNPESPEVAQNPHHHPEPSIVQDELPIAQDEPLYKDPFKDPFKEKNTLLLGTEQSEEGKQKIDDFQSQSYQSSSHALNGNPSKVAAVVGSGEKFSAGSKAQIHKIAFEGRQAWISKGIALGLWASKDLAIDFQGQVTQYARNQTWCKSPLDYTNSIIKGLLAGDNPKADRYWEAWRNGHPIGWENLFDWEVQPGIINPAFANWVETSLFDSTKLPAANAAIAAKELRFNARSLWERFQRAVAREVETADVYRQRGQNYLPSGAFLPRFDQPTTQATYAGLSQLSNSSPIRPQVVSTVPDRAEMILETAANGQENALAVDESIELPKINFLSSINLAKSSHESVRPLTLQLLKLVIAQRSLLQKQYRRRKPPCDLASMAKYLVWAEHGDEFMQREAIAWLEANDLVFGSE
jgi:hypothetical protein